MIFLDRNGNPGYTLGDSPPEGCIPATPEMLTAWSEPAPAPSLPLTPAEQSLKMLQDERLEPSGYSFATGRVIK